MADSLSPSLRVFSPACCPRFRSFFFNRFSTFILLFSFLVYVLLFQLDFVPQLLPPHFRSWQSQVSRYIHRLDSPSQRDLLPPPPDVNCSSYVPRLKQETPQPPERRFLNGSRVAVCIVGGARAFELTGPSIIKYLLRANNNTDVFLHAPLDKDTHKLSLLKDVPNLVHVRIFPHQRLPETKISRDVLTASNSPNGVQGLLQYFNLVEECINMIEQYQSNHRFLYDWIVRTRFDGYWNDHLPSLDKMDHTAYTVPSGSQFGGLNDRLGIGNWETSKVALSRRSLLPALHDHGLRGLNSESSFKQQLKICHVHHKLKRFPFCILSHRTYGWPPGQYGVPVVSISSRGALNGAKCRPCTPVATGASAKSIVDAQVKSWAWTGIGDGVELCRPTGDWEVNWEGIFDRVAGHEFQAVRREMQNRKLMDCIEAVEAFKKQVAFWDAMSPTAICEKGLAP